MTSTRRKLTDLDVEVLRAAASRRELFIPRGDPRTEDAYRLARAGLLSHTHGLALTGDVYEITDAGRTALDNADRSIR